MTFLLDKRDPTDLAPINGVSKPLGTAAENLSIAYEDSVSNEQGNSEGKLLADIWSPIIDRLNDESNLTPSIDIFSSAPSPYRIDKIINVHPFRLAETLYRTAFPKERGPKEAFYNPAHHLTSSMLMPSLLPNNNERMYKLRVKEIVDFIRENKETYQDLQWVTDESVLRLAMDRAKEDRRRLQELENRSPGARNVIARFLGNVGGSVTDPINVESAFIGMGAVRTLTGAIFTEALIGAGVEVMAQPKVKEWYEKLGYNYTSEQFWFSVASGATFGAGMPVLFRGGGIALRAGGKAGAKAISLTTDQMKKGYKAIVDSGAYKPTPVDRTVERQANNIEDDIASNPLEDNIVHEARVDEATRAFENNEAPIMPNVPESPLRASDSVYDADNIDGLIYRFDPTEIQVDAQTFQFKAGGDEFGVSERLQGITQWDPIKAGQITVFEYANGSRFIADGHQRLGLAKRIKSQDPNQDVRLYGHLLREVDGVTPEMARVIAAVKNIAEGTGTAIDAAKVLRIAPERVGELPPRSALVRQAQGLTMLSDEGFGAVVNDVVPANYAALVGRLIPEDVGLQNNAISVLAKTDPANEFQAETIIRQVREAGAERITQDSLFGEEVITESFFVERMNIMDRAQKQLRQDKNAFKSLVNNAERLEAEGNQLAKNANQRRATNDEQAIALLQSLANVKGPISDALNAAARAARESGSYTEPTRNFVDAIRVTAESGDLNRLSAGDVGQLINVAKEGSTPPVTERAVEDFDEPGGAGVRQQGDQLEQDVFGEIEEALQPDVALRDDLRRVIDEGADEATVDAHPAVTKAIDEAMSVPRTDQAEGFGTESWISSREFNFDGESIVGYEAAVFRLYDDATKLGWTASRLDPPEAPVKAEKKAVIILGPPASGKSTFANPIARKMNAAILDADEAKKVLPEYQGGIGANAVHEESSIIAGALEEYATALGTNVVIPKVGGNKESIKRLIERLKSRGYEIDLFDMQVNYGNARNRMFIRFINSGRLVPPQYLRDVGDNPSKTYDALKKEGVADGYTRVDNNVERDAAKPIIDDTRGILEGVDLRTTSIRGPRGEDGARPIDTRDGEEFIEEIPETDLDLEVPIDFRADPETGDLVAQTVTLRQIQDDIKQDVRMLDRLRGCVR